MYGIMDNTGNGIATGEHAHFMMKEMHEEPQVIRATLGPRIREDRIALGLQMLTDNFVQRLEKIHIIASGTAYHAGMIGKYTLERMTRIPVEVDVSSEFRYRDPIVGKNHLAIIISQSGETPDTLMAMREAKRKGAAVLAIVNVVDSAIAREADAVLYTWAGPEIALASTKAYNAMLAAIYLLSCDFARRLDLMDEKQQGEAATALSALPGALEVVIRNRAIVQRFAMQHVDVRNIFFIGRGLDYALCMEGSLKIKEISCIHSEAYAGGELKHGTMALIEKGTLVICPLTQQSLMEKMIVNIREVKAKGAVVMVVTTARMAGLLEPVADIVIPIPDVEPRFAPLVAVTPLQLFAYYMAVLRGMNIDKPRNLVKSVTIANPRTLFGSKQ